MPIGAIGTAALTTGLGMVGNLFQQHLSYKANKKLMAQQNEYNRQQAEWQNQVNLQNWQLENEYNTPANQIQRMQEAGLNPNLMYGNGTASAGNAGSVAPAASVDAAPAPQLDLSLGDIGKSFMDTYTKIKQNEYMDSQKQFTEAQRDNAYMDSLIKQTQNERDKVALAREIIGLDVDKHTRDSIIRNIFLQGEESQARVDNLRTSSDLMDSQRLLNQEQVNKIKREYRLTDAQVSQIAQNIRESAARIVHMAYANAFTQSQTRGSDLSNMFNSDTYDSRVSQVQQILVNAILQGRGMRVEQVAREIQNELDIQYHGANGTFSDITRIVAAFSGGISGQTESNVQQAQQRYD